MTHVLAEIRILIADDHAMSREALRTVLEQESDLCIVGETSNGRDTLESVGKLRPDILLLSLNEPHFHGLQILQELGRGKARVWTIVQIDSSEKRQIVEALRLGARGIVCRHTTPQMLFKSIRTVASGEYWVGHKDILDIIDCLRTDGSAAMESAYPSDLRLTNREIDIIGLIVDGYTNKDIAQKCQISQQTVKHHLTSIFEKVGVSNRLELALFAMHREMGRPSAPSPAN